MDEDRPTRPWLPASLFVAGGVVGFYVSLVCILVIEAAGQGSRLDGDTGGLAISLVLAGAAFALLRGRTARIAVMGWAATATGLLAAMASPVAGLLVAALTAPVIRRVRMPWIPTALAVGAGFIATMAFSLAAAEWDALASWTGSLVAATTLILLLVAAASEPTRSARRTALGLASAWTLAVAVYAISDILRFQDAVTWIGAGVAAGMLVSTAWAWTRTRTLAVAAY